MLPVLAALVLFAQAGAPAAAPSPVQLTEEQKRVANEALDALAAETTATLRLSPACRFELEMTGNPKSRHHNVRITVLYLDEEAELPTSGRLAFVRVHVDAYEKKIKKGKDDLLEFFPFEGDLVEGVLESVVPYDRFLEFARPIVGNLYIVGIDGQKGSQCMLDLDGMAALHAFRAKLK